MTVERPTRPIGFRVGWGALVLITGVSLLSHLAGPFLGYIDTDAQTLAILALAGMNVYALAVLVTAYRRAEPWAWWVTWAMIAIYGLVILYAPIAGRYYVGGAVAMAVAQLAAWSVFQRGPGGGP